jgi:hypothetical protein
LGIDVPPELEAGAYANFLWTWHTAHEFTLDFAALVGEGRAPIVEPDPSDTRLLVVSRVKVAPSTVFDMIRSIHGNMTLYEERFGAIQYPERREEDEA